MVPSSLSEWPRSQGLLLEKACLGVIHLQVLSCPQGLIWKSLLSNPTTWSFNRSAISWDVPVCGACLLDGESAGGAFPKGRGRRGNQYSVFCFPCLAVAFFVFCFLGPNLWHMKIPRVESELHM